MIDRILARLVLLNELYKIYRGTKGGQYTMATNYMGEVLISFMMIMGDYTEEASNEEADPA